MSFGAFENLGSSGGEFLRVDSAESIPQFDAMDAIAETAEPFTGVGELAAGGDAGEVSDDGSPMDSGEVSGALSRIRDWIDEVTGRNDSGEWDWIDGLYTSVKERIEFALNTLGEWHGKEGDSLITPDLSTEKGVAAAEKLAEFGQAGVEFRKGVVDFSPCSVAEIQIDRMDAERPNNRSAILNGFREQFDKTMPLPNGEKWKCEAVADWITANGLEKHECSDMKTVQLVPAEIHQYFKHYGG